LSQRGRGFLGIPIESIHDRQPDRRGRERRISIERLVECLLRAGPVAALQQEHAVGGVK
jgi:hypothetical protein